MRFVVPPFLADSRLFLSLSAHDGRILAAAALAATLLLNGCATAPAATAGRGTGAAVLASAPSSSSSGSSSAGSSGGSSAAPAFEQVVRGAKRYDGMLPIWHRQEKAWIELSPEDFGKPFFLSPRLSTGIGEAGVFGGLMQSRWAQVGRPQWVEFRKVNQQVQLLAVNATFTAQRGTPQARAVASAFSPSLLASVPLASSPQGRSGKVLIEANALLMTDMLGLAQQLQRSYRQGYALDTRHSTLLRAQPHEEGLLFELSQHFATSSISSGGSTVPLSVPDPRSLFITVRYALTPLPGSPMATRPADARVGYFATTVADFTNDLARTPRLRHINRWRLEKKDPDTALSEPVRPIVYRLDESIPEAYREAIRDGVLVWNKAFEKIGFQNAVQVRMPAADGEPEGWEPGEATIRWMTNSQPSFGALGPTHVDPRTGEILDADIAIESLSSRSMRTTRSQFLSILQPPSSARPAGARAASPLASAKPDAAPADEVDGHAHENGSCEYSAQAAEQLGMAMDVLEARGLLDPDGPEVQAFVLAYLKDTTMHEVGHTLGLRHNFRASRWRTDAELNDPALGEEGGNSASVMDYAPINLPLPGHPAGASFQTTLGPYDYWAIEYGYKPLPADKAQADAMLREIARRSESPQWADALAYGSDEDYAQGLDPEALVFDLGRNPVAYARTRLAIVRDLFERQATRRLKPEDDPSLLRRSVGYGLREMERTGQILMRQIGGIVTRRDGPDSTRALLEPLPAAQQRAALRMLAQDFLSPDAVKLSPALQRRLVPDYLDRQMNDDSASSTDFSLAEQQLALQRGVLSGLMSETLSERLLDNIDKTRDTERSPLTPQELHRPLREAIWSGKAHPRTQDGATRNLQREHVRRLAEAIARNDSDRADVRALLRGEATQLLAQLRAQKPGADAIEAAHRRDCIDTLASALSPSIVRMAAP